MVKYIKYIFILIFCLKIAFAQENSADTPTAKSRKAAGGPHLKIELIKQEATADTPNSRARRALTIDTSAKASKDAPKTDGSAKEGENVLFSARARGSAFIPTETSRTGRTSAPPVPNTPRPRVPNTPKPQDLNSTNTGSAAKLDRTKSASSSVSPEHARNLSVTGLNSQINTGKLSEDFSGLISASPRESDFYYDNDQAQSGLNSGASSTKSDSAAQLDRKTSATKPSPDNPRGSHSRRPSASVTALNAFLSDRADSSNLSADLPQSQKGSKEPGIEEAVDEEEDPEEQKAKEALGFNITNNNARDTKTKLEPKDSKKIVLIFLSAFVLSFSVLYKYNKNFNQKINNFLKKIKLKISNWVCEEPKDNNQDNKPDKDKDKDKNNANQNSIGNLKNS